MTAPVDSLAIIGAGTASAISASLPSQTAGGSETVQILGILCPVIVALANAWFAYMMHKENKRRKSGN